MQLKRVRNTELCNYNSPASMELTLSSSMHMQPNTLTHEAFSSISTKFNPYFGWCCRLYVIKSCRCARECFMCTCVWLHVHA